MKIKQQDLEKLKSYIEPVISNNLISCYELGQFPRADKVKDLQKRFCFDVLHMSKVKIGDGRGMPGDINLYEYMDDSHIYTALKSICPTVTRKY